MKQIEVQILGQVYMLGCPDGGETLLRSAVTAVDREMLVIKEAGKVRARERIAVLAALNLAYQLAERGPATPPTGTATQQDETDTAHTDASIDALVRRIDEALAEDGQLL